MLNKQEKSEKTNQDNEVSLQYIVKKGIDFLFFAKKKWKILILSSIIGLVFSIGFTYIENPEYKAVLKFALEEDKGGASVGGALGIASQLGLDIGSNGGLFAGSNIIELMKSRFIIEKTLLTQVVIGNKKCTLAEYFLNTGSLNLKLKNKISDYFKNIEDRNSLSRDQNLILENIYNYLVKYDINISQKDKKVSIVSIEITSKDELFSKLFCEMLAKQTSDFYIKIKSEKAKMNVEVLQNQVDSVRRQLDIALYNVASYSDRIYNLNPSLIKKSAPTRRSQIDVQANTAVLTQLVTNLEISKVTLRKETPLIQILDSPVFPLEVLKTNKVIFSIICTLIFPMITILILILSDFIRSEINKY